MSSEGASDLRVVLVPDLDGEPLRPLRVLIEILQDLGTWEADDRADPPERAPLRLSAPLADREALAVARRLHAAVRSTQSLGPTHGRLLGPDGAYEHPRVSMVALQSGDVEVLSATARILGHPALLSDVADVVESYARALVGDAYTCQPPYRPELISLVARVAGLLDLAPTRDTELLVSRLVSNPPGIDLALTDAEEAAYQRTADRWSAMWNLGSEVARFPF